MNFTEVDKGTDVDVSVREQDQNSINEFSRNNARLQDLEGELATSKVKTPLNAIPFHFRVAHVGKCVPRGGAAKHLVFGKAVARGSPWPPWSRDRHDMTCAN